MKGISNWGHYSEGNLIWRGNYHDLTSGSRCRVMFLEAGARSSNAGWRAEELPRAEVIYVCMYVCNVCNIKRKFQINLLAKAFKSYIYTCVSSDAQVTHCITVKLLPEFLRSIFAMEIIQRKSNMVVYHFWFLMSDICPICQPYWDCQIV